MCVSGGVIIEKENRILIKCLHFPRCCKCVEVHSTAQQMLSSPSPASSIHSPGAFSVGNGEENLNNCINTHTHTHGRQLAGAFSCVFLSSFYSVFLSHPDGSFSAPLRGRAHRSDSLFSIYSWHTGVYRIGHLPAVYRVPYTGAACHRRPGASDSPITHLCAEGTLLVAGRVT